MVNLKEILKTLYPIIVDILKALLTPAISIGLIYIAWQQYRTNKNKLRLDLYERRYAAYEAYRDLFIIVSKIRGCPDLEQVRKFGITISESSFLFDKDIVDYFNEVKEKINELYKYDGLLSNPNLSASESKDLARKKTKIKEWFNDQTNISIDKFKKYLSFEKVKV